MNEKTMTETDMNSTMTIAPIGIIRNNIPVPPLVAGKDGLEHNAVYDSAMETMKETPGSISEIILDDRFTDLLDGIEDYSHIVVFYWAHRVPAAGRRLVRIHPAGLSDYPEKGIFATCSPARPNPILMTVVRLLKREKDRVSVQGLDAIDNSPVLDIKPYVSEMYPREGVCIPGWMEKIMKEISKRRELTG